MALGIIQQAFKKMNKDFLELEQKYESHQCIPISEIYQVIRTSQQELIEKIKQMKPYATYNNGKVKLMDLRELIGDNKND